ncbi:MAG: oligopeptide/dipeptide ABC transporter ATP-binding protein [Opitutales bacterium]|jgi:oligopeptide/dipeptide ABC transporter ATP-binding protein
MPATLTDSPDTISGSESKAPLLEIRDLRMHFPVKGGILMRERGLLKAVDGVSLELRAGETLGLVGESGCGKSTLGKCVARLYEPRSGSIFFEGRDITKLSQHALKPIRRNIQMIFQDPAESLNSRLTIGDILEEPFIIHGIGRPSRRRDMVRELLGKVGLEAEAADRFPFEFSGGQRQRVGIARAIALNPRLIVCDEPVSALDVSVQSQIINLLLELQRELGLSYVFIAHDLAVVKHISDRIAIMYLGRVVELADSDEIFANPVHAYTQALLAAIPKPDPRAKAAGKILRGEVPSPIDPPPGCAFASRSPLPHTPAQASQDPFWKEVAPGHWADVHPATVRDWEKHLREEERARFQ